MYNGVVFGSTSFLRDGCFKPGCLLALERRLKLFIVNILLELDDIENPQSGAVEDIPQMNEPLELLIVGDLHHAS